MSRDNQPMLSRLMQQAVKSSENGHQDTNLAFGALEDLLSNENSRLTSRQKARIQRLLELTGRRAKEANAITQQASHGQNKNIHIEARELGTIQWPKISIVTPTYKQGQFIEATILSILNQSYPNLEYIIIDGGSPDNTLEIIDKYRDKITTVISEPDKGQSNAINKGMRLTTGEVLYWLNSDDMLEPNTLLFVGLQYLENKFDLLAGTCTPFNNDSGKLNNRHMATLPFGLRIEDITDIKETWLKGMYFHQPEVFFSRRLWEAAGGFVDEDLYFSMDYDLWARMAMASEFTARVQTSGKSFCLYREHSSQKTNTVEAYLPELLSHSQTLRERHLGKAVKGDFCTAKDYRQKLSIVSISDFGFHGGAGVAHKRVCQVLQAAGHDVIQLSGFQKWQSETIEQPVDSFIEALEILQPDLILLGNLHNLKRGLEIAEVCTRDFPTIAIAHDFWWLTGRCAYTHGCHYLFTRCSNVCPTPQEYPRLDPLDIRVHHQRKKHLLQNPNFFVLANSSYTQDIYTDAIKAWSVKSNAVGLVSLPIVPEGDFELRFPEERLQPVRNSLTSKKIRIVLGCTDHADFRKGTDLAALALHRLMAEHPEVQLDVYGRSSDLILDSLAEFSNRILLHGYLTSQQQYHELLESGDIFLGTSREETLGQTFVEAAHAGLITVGPILSGYADVVKCCRYSLGYEGVDVAAISSAVEQAISLVKHHDRALIKSVQKGQSQAGFSGMSFLADFNHHIYVSGLWKRLRYHGPTKVFDIKYGLLEIEELTLAASTQADEPGNDPNGIPSLQTEGVEVSVDLWKLGPGLYLESNDGKSVTWLTSHATFVLPNPTRLSLLSISFRCHWIPDEMRQTECLLKICGAGEYRALVPSIGNNDILFSFCKDDRSSLGTSSKLLASLRFSKSIILDDGRDNLCLVCYGATLRGLSHPQGQDKPR